MSLVTTPITWVSGQVVTAAQMNAEVRDAVTGVQAAWTAYTPTWTMSTTNPVIGNGTLVGRFSRIGKTIDFMIQITMGSTTTFGTGAQWILSLPVTAAFVGQGYNAMCLDSSTTGKFLATAYPVSTSAVGLLTIAQPGAGVTATVPLPWAVSDVLTVVGRYETT